MITIPFNKPYIAGKEFYYMAQAVFSGHISGDGSFSKKCQTFIEEKLGVKKVLLTTSGTSALDMAAILCRIGEGDEVILPSFTFVSTANAFFLRGAKLVFADIRPDTLNIDEKIVPGLCSEQTKTIVPVHYAGVGCEMDDLMDCARKNGINVVEDAAQGINAKYKEKHLGTFGHLGALSFHETKNISCGEGGALLINDESLVERAEIVREKGTDRSKFFRGEIDKYTWVDIGSSYLPSDLLAAFLLAQLERTEEITARRKQIFDAYLAGLAQLETKGYVRLPAIPGHCQSNFHMFYILLENEEIRDGLIQYLRSQGILAVFHYLPLHLSPVGRSLGYREGQLPITESVSKRLVRLPFYYELTAEDQEKIIRLIFSFYAS